MALSVGQSFFDFVIEGAPTLQILALVFGFDQGGDGVSQDRSRDGVSEGSGEGAFCGRLSGGEEQDRERSILSAQFGDERSGLVVSELGVDDGQGQVSVGYFLSGPCPISGGDRFKCVRRELAQDLFEQRHITAGDEDLVHGVFLAREGGFIHQ